MIIKMKYPKDSKNKNFDGKIHDINPTRLVKINNSNIFILDYDDITLNKRMYTVLINIDNKLYKLPLKNYNYFNLLKAKYRLNSVGCSLELLTTTIDCENIISIDELKEIIKMENKSLSHIYYNTADNKYYGDPDRTILIKGAPESLGKLSDDKKMIIGFDTDYIIINVHILRKNKVSIYFNEYDNKYCWDKECTTLIPIPIDYLGELSSDKSEIISDDVVYVIIRVYVEKNKTYEEENNNNYTNTQNTINQSININKCLYDDEKQVFYLSPNIIHKYLLFGNLVDVSYFYLDDKSKQINTNNLYRVCLIDISDEKIKMELLNQSKKIASHIPTKKGSTTIKIYNNQNSNKYIACDASKLKNKRYFNAKNIEIKNDHYYIKSTVIPYNTNLRIQIEELFDTELVFDTIPIITKEISIIIYVDSNENAYIDKLEAYKIFGHSTYNNYYMLNQEEYEYIINSYDTVKKRMDNNYTDDDDDYLQYRMII